MANIKSAKKRMLISSKKHDRNRVVRSAVKTHVTRVRRLVDGGETAPVAEVKAAVKALDQAAERGILHPNNAARRKSRLMRQGYRQGQAEGGGQKVTLRSPAAAPAAAAARRRCLAPRPVGLSLWRPGYGGTRQLRPQGSRRLVAQHLRRAAAADEDASEPHPQPNLR
jgi:small subunit ribosomal protein S20